RNYKKGDEIETVVLAVDAERERISLGVKQLAQDPFSTYVAEHGKGVIVTGTVLSVDQRMVVVTLAEGIEATLRASEMSIDKVDDARKLVKEGDEIEAMVIAVDRKKRAISLSVKAKESEDEAAVLQEYSSDSEAGTAKLGDLLREQLDSRDR
ncbi:MAG: S1 RNA-binding domain-containing protein, partial [Rhodoferax sp.]|nr:S1 RNA-binding domain-containing protein [Rhodoferax sp.]